VYSYTAFGLDIRSVFEMPELLASASGKTDVFIQTEKLNWSPPKVSDEGTYFHVTAKEAYLFWENVGTFIVRNGQEIIIHPRLNVAEAVIRLPLLGTVMASLLHQRGLLVLHASAVALNGNVVAFMGDKGQGKSTMAATLYCLGHQLVADDLVAIDFDTTCNPQVIPGFPQFKLWPEAAIALGEDPAILPQIHPQVEKRARLTFDRFATIPLPLRRLYVLNQGKFPAIQTLQPQQVIKYLISNSYMTRFGKQFLQAQEASRHFHQCMALAKKISINSIERPLCLDLLSNVARLVEKDLADEYQDLR
jgi:hypothetical protein